MRVGEILALTPKDIDFSQQTINVSKTISRDEYDRFIVKEGTKTYAGTRTIPFDDNLKEVLKDSLAHSEDNEFGLIFTQNGKIIRPTSLNTTFKKICKKLDFEGSYNFHMLRHTFATRCIEAGMPAHVLQKLLGHTDVSTTINTYTSIFDKYKQDEFEKYVAYKNKHNI
jgi:integrase